MKERYLHGTKNRPGGQPQQRQNHLVQCSDRFQPVRWKLARRHGGEERGQTEAAQRRRHHRSARHLLPISVYPGGGCGTELFDRRTPRRHFKHRRRHQPGAQPVLNHPADGAGDPRCRRHQHDGRGEKERGQDQRAGALSRAGMQGGGNFRAEGRRHYGGSRSGHHRCQKRKNRPHAHLLRRSRARHRPHRRSCRSQYACRTAALVRNQTL